MVSKERCNFSRDEYPSAVGTEARMAAGHLGTGNVGEEHFQAIPCLPGGDDGRVASVGRDKGFLEKAPFLICTDSISLGEGVNLRRIPLIWRIGVGECIPSGSLHSTTQSYSREPPPVVVRLIKLQECM